MKRTILLATAASLSFLTAGAALADVVYLKNGQKYEGVAEEKDGGLVVRLERGSLTFTKDQVDRVEKGTPPWEVYDQKAKELKREDVSGHMDLARWCKAHNLPMRMKRELEQVVIADPDNAEARALLGHVKAKDKWLTVEEQQAAKDPGKDGPAGPKGPGTAARPNAPPDGSYRGKSRGYQGDVEVEVTVVLGKISEVKVVDHKETRPRKAIADVPARIVSQQRVAVDGTSSATLTSTAIKRAAASALASVRPVALGAVPDGTYTDRSRGKNGDVTVQVAVKGGRITAVAVSSHSESQPNEALKDVPARILESQSTQVDAVTGEDATSWAIMRAVQTALEKAAATGAATPAK